MRASALAVLALALALASVAPRALAGCAGQSHCIDVAALADSLAGTVTGQGQDGVLLRLALPVVSADPRNLAVFALTEDGSKTLGEARLHAVQSQSLAPVSVGIPLRSVQESQAFLGGVVTQLSVTVSAYFATDDLSYDADNATLVAKTIVVTRPALPLRELISVLAPAPAPKPHRRQASSSPCPDGGAGGCIDAASLPTVPAAGGTFTATVRAWAATAKDLFVEVHDTSNGAILSNYGWASLPASTASAWSSVSIALTVPALTGASYNYYVWMSEPGAGWTARTYSQTFPITLASLTSPCTTSGPCVDLTSLTPTLPSAGGTLTLTVRAWSATPKDLFVEVHQTSNGALVSNYAFAAVAAATSASWGSYQVQLTVPALTGGPYNYYIWMSDPGAGWSTTVYGITSPITLSSNQGGTVTLSSASPAAATTTAARATTTSPAVTRTCDSIYSSVQAGNAPSAQDVADWNAWQCSTWYTSGLTPCANSAARCVSGLPTTVPSTGHVTFSVSAFSVVREDLVFQIQQNGVAASPENRAAVISTNNALVTISFSLTYTSTLTSAPFTLVWYFAPTGQGFSSATGSGSANVALAAMTSPCANGGAGGCIDTTSIPLSLPYSIGTFTITIGAWSATAKDMFVLVQQASSTATVSNYGYASVAAATTSAYSMYSVTLTVPPLTSGPYNIYVWMTDPGKGWPGMTYQYLSPVTVTGIVTPVPGGGSPAGAYIDSCKTPGQYAFTFDDGPFIYTEAVKAILKKYNIKATFFVNGYNWGNITDFIPTLQDSVAQGHQIGLHGWSHCDFTDHVNCPYNTEVDRLAEVVKSNIGVYPTYFRFPYGSYDDNAQQYMASKGYRIAGWNVDTNDWQAANKADPNLSFQNIQAALNVTNAGVFSAISLSHDVHNTTGATPNSYLERAIQYVLAQGYTPVTVAQCDNDPSGGYRQ